MATKRWIGRTLAGLALTGVAGMALVALAQPTAPPGERINQEGRKLPDMPKITTTIMYNTPESDKVLEAMQIYPVNNPWNEDVSKRPLLPNSDAMIKKIGADRALGFNRDMGWAIIPPDQKKVEVKITQYPEDTDKDENGKFAYPIPDNAPIEDWDGADLNKLHQMQRVGEGDRHSIIIDPVNRKLYELYNVRLTDKGWEAGNEATFDLASNKLRPDGWTSGDAAGLPIFVGTVRYDEVERGMVEHAIRVTFRLTQRKYIYPATHQAGKRQATADDPAMGQRFRLKATADLSGLSKHALAIAKGMQKYGLINADNGQNWLISVSPDKRISAESLNELKKFKGGDFEVIQTTGPDEGPRAK